MKSALIETSSPRQPEQRYALDTSPQTKVHTTRYLQLSKLDWAVFIDSRRATDEFLLTGPTNALPPARFG